MSFITRCPACATAFKVVSDQLKISEGWVRCGHCHQIFDATLDLQPWWPGVEETPPTGGSTMSSGGQTDPVNQGQAGLVPPPDTATKVQAETPSDRPVEVREDPTAKPSDASEDVLSRSWFDVPADGAEPVRAGSLSEPVVSVDEGSGSQANSVESWRTPLPDANTTEASVPPIADDDALSATDWTTDARAEDAVDEQPAVENDPAEPANHFQPSFVKQAQRRAYWRRPWVRVLLGVALLALLLLLGLQASVYWRDDLAAQVPQTQPALEKLCAPLDCEVAPPKPLEQVLIDSSVLLRRAPGRYTFNLVVRNAADVEVAAPALELTLTDIHDQVLVRRVIPASEWPQSRATLAAGAEWPVQFELELASPEAQVMTGYRAILFYP